MMTTFDERKLALAVPAPEAARKLRYLGYASRPGNAPGAYCRIASPAWTITIYRDYAALRGQIDQARAVLVEAGVLR